MGRQAAVVDVSFNPDSVGPTQRTGPSRREQLIVIGPALVFLVFHL